ADDRLRRPRRHTGGDDAWLRRGRPTRGRGDDGRRARRTSRSRRDPYPRPHALRETAALPRLPRLPRLRGMTATARKNGTGVKHRRARHRPGRRREKQTNTADFRRLIDELTLLLTYEATKDFPTELVEIETPLEQTTVERISGKKVAVCPVLRAGV